MDYHLKRAIDSLKIIEEDASLPRDIAVIAETARFHIEKFIENYSPSMKAELERLQVKVSFEEGCR